MKKIFLLFIPIFYLSFCYAQDTVEQRNRLSDSVIERFFVLRSNKNIRQGPYRAFFQRRIVVARGNYRNNKKVGIWNFYDQSGRLAQTFNSDLNVITYEAPQINDDFTYAIDDTLKATDKTRRPIKIGGSYYGFIPYITAFQMPFDVFDLNTDSFDAYVELLISPLGRLADYKVHVASARYDYNHTFDLDVHLFSEADRTFIPATLNDTQVLSRILIKCFVTDKGGLEFF